MRRLDSNFGNFAHAHLRTKRSRQQSYDRGNEKKREEKAWHVAPDIAGKLSSVIRTQLLSCQAVDKGKRKRIADIAEKLGVGLVLGTLVQGIFIKELSFPVSVAAIILSAIAAILLMAAVYLSRED